MLTSIDFPVEVGWDISYGATQTSQQTSHSLVLNHHLHTMDNTSVHFGRILLGLQLSLEL
jgi:hypothetical protein